MEKAFSSFGIATAIAASLGLTPIARGEALVAVGKKSEKLVEDRKPLFGFTSYAGLGGGGAFIGDTFAPDGRVEAGWQIWPWFGIASFTSIQPLHDITDIVPQEDSFARRFGTAWAGWRFVEADYLGLDASDFSRPELGVEIKAAWKTLIY